MTNAQEFIAHMLVSSPRGRVILKALEAAAFFTGVMIAAWIVYMIDTRFFPVIKNWQVDYMHVSGPDLVVGGRMTKTRPCELIATHVVAVPSAPLAPRFGIYKIDGNAPLVEANMPVGNHKWGPLVIAVPRRLIENRDNLSSLEVVAVHRCHAFWLQETRYGRIRMEDLPI